VLIIPPNTVVLLARAAQQLDYHSAPRQRAMKSGRFNLISHPRRTGHSRISHLHTSEVVDRSFLTPPGAQRNGEIR
jgi:hypothetical protein